LPRIRHINGQRSPAAAHDRSSVVQRVLDRVLFHLPQWDSLIRPKSEPQTELGRDVKSRTDMPRILIDRLVRQRATKALKTFKDRGKPS